MEMKPTWYWEDDLEKTQKFIEAHVRNSMDLCTATLLNWRRSCSHFRDVNYGEIHWIVPHKK
jgi:hypothetical protein